MTTVRDDLLSLTDTALAALTNRGLLNRAAQAVESGSGPTAAVDPDGTVHGAHPDGTRTRLPTGGLDAARCSCGAAGTCRHVVMLVLAYQRAAAAPLTAPSALERWSPAEFSDAQLAEVFGARRLSTARRHYRVGYAARVRRPTAEEPVPTVELPTGTVRFLVPHQLAYAFPDAAPGAAATPVALAVWAYRAADEQAPDAPEVLVEVGGPTTEVPGVGSDAFDRAVTLAGEVLLDGAVHTGAGVAAAFASVRRGLDKASLRWPVLILDDLREQLGAYRDRSARYRPERLAELLAELVGRHRAAAADRGPGAAPRSQVLGTEVPAKTPLRRGRFTGLGCRISGNAEERTAEVFLADTETATVLVLHRRWDVSAQPAAPTGARLGRHRVAGAQLAALATGHVVTESAARSASRRLTLASTRVAPTSVTPTFGDWDGVVPDRLMVADLVALERQLLRLPPRLLRPRVDADLVRVVKVGKVGEIGYAPGDQRLAALITGAAGGDATVCAEYQAACPAALDSLAAALAGERGTPRFVSGTVRLTRRGLVISPLAVVAGETVVVPDLAEGMGDAPLGPGTAAPVDAATAALERGLDLLAEVAHHGARHLPPTFPDRIRDIARQLSRVGLERCAEAVAALAATLGPAPGAATVRAWMDAQIRLLVTDEVGRVTPDSLA